ncbi:alpha/beta fold hydrolase [Alcanivorax sp. S71-1-4]|uniref:alpha/beta fold hydrolase n=1 Tax=Alcanivorax sp. S71-1-4 TaxID=1177159 RepID=UPI001F21A138|nr:alpha/beta fold hydrolase [Alcanivorax sp. S71-1-4]
MAAHSGEQIVSGKNHHDALIGKIYDTSLMPGDWVDLLDTIAGWAGEQPDASGDASVEPLISHLERAVRSSSYIHALEDRNRILNSMYHQMPWPMLMLDDQMQVLECNPAAHRALADGPVQLLADGRLRFRDGELRRALKRVNTMAAGRQVQLLNSARDTLTLLCLPVEKSDAPGPVAHIRTIVWMLSGHHVVMPSPEMLQSVFNITQAESRLLHLLCKLGNLQQSAALLSISVHTARTQLKSTMAKLNASSQVQLVSQAMGHALVQTAQPEQAPPDTEYTMNLPDGRVLSWYEYGDPKGRPLLTLDNLGGAVPDHTLFDDWYRQQGLRVILVIRPGYGLSTARRGMQFRDLGPDLRALCGHLNLCRPSMAAYCGGGPYALCAAALEPDLFDRLGLLATTVPIEHFELDKLDRIHAMFLRLFRRDPRLFVLVGRLALRGVQRAPEKYFSRLAQSLCPGDQQVLNDPDLLARLIRRMRQSHFQGARIIIDEYLRLQQPWGVDLSQISIPVLMWHGDDDRVISVGGAHALARDIPGAQFRALPGLGRFLIYRVWQDFLTALLALPQAAPDPHGTSALHAPSPRS